MNDNWPIVNFIVRWILGLLFLMAGYWKVFVLTPASHAQQFFVEGFSDTWIPTWLLQVFGYSIPFLEPAREGAVLSLTEFFDSRCMPLKALMMWPAQGLQYNAVILPRGENSLHCSLRVRNQWSIE